ncbi:MAG: type II CAAX endopeptidase family protein [Terriglobales bacterium]
MSHDRDGFTIVTASARTTMDEFDPSTHPVPPQSLPPEGSASDQLRPAFPVQRGHVLFIGPEGLRAGWRIFLYLGMGVVVFFLLSTFVALISERAGSLWRDMFTEAVMAISALAPACVMARIEDRPFGAYGLPVRQVFGKQFWLGAAWGIASFSFLMLLLRGIGVFSLGHLALHGERALKFALFWAIYFLLVGFFEEFALRGYVQFTLGNSVGFWPSALLLSLVFGGIHIFNSGEAWIGELGAAAIGLFFCLTLRRTGSLWFAVGMHASWDWAESYLYSVPDSGGMVPGHLMHSSFHGSRWLTGGSVGPEGSVLLFVVIALLWVGFDRVMKDGRPERSLKGARPS